MFPRSSFQIGALCLTLFTSFILLFNRSNAPSSLNGIRSLRYSGVGRAPATPPCDVYAKVNVDEPAHDPIWDIQNRTLGFQKIYAISMPHRVDKKDTLALMALVSDLDIEFIDGVNGSSIHPSAMPPYWKGERAAGAIGCWRAHLNVYQIMARERIQSALVIEDDADWDVLIRSQMTEFARGTRFIRNATLPMHSPYGDNWDLMTLGHIGINNFPNRDQRYWVTKNDPTVIADVRREWMRKPDISAPALGGDHTRIVMEVSKMSATAAYAVSLRGAARLLYDQSMLPNSEAIDMAMLKLCRHDTWGLPFCLGAYPMIFGRYRAIGPMSKDSDRRQQSNEAAEPGKEPMFQSQDERLEPESQLTVFPVSLNIGRLLKSEKIIPSVDPKSDLLPEMNLEKFVFPRGEGISVTPREYVAQIATTKEDKALVVNKLAIKTEATSIKVKEPETTLVEPTPEASGELDVRRKYHIRRRNGNA